MQVSLNKFIIEAVESALLNSHFYLRNLKIFSPKINYQFKFKPLNTYQKIINTVSANTMLIQLDLYFTYLQSKAFSECNFHAATVDYRKNSRPPHKIDGVFTTASKEAGPCAIPNTNKTLLYARLYRQESKPQTLLTSDKQSRKAYW